MLENSLPARVKYLLYGIVKGHFYVAKCTQTCRGASQKQERVKRRGWVERGRSFSPKMLYLWKKKQARVYSMQRVWKNLWLGMTESTANSSDENLWEKSPTAAQTFKST